MRLNVVAASTLAVSVSARSNPLVERELAARALVNVNPAGSTCPPVPTTVIVLQPALNGTATTTITTTTTVFPGQTTSTTPSASAFIPPFTLGQGLPSGGVTNLPFEQFLFLAYSTPAPAPFAKRNVDLERRQARVQATASPITLVDISVPSPGAPAQAAVNCDNATPLDLVNGVLNGKGFSVGKLLDSRDAVLGALLNPPANQVNLTFSIQNGLLQWNAPDVGGASFYSCSNVIYAGFPNLQIPGCNQVIVGPIAGAVCIQYVTSTRSVNPTFTAPLTSSSSSASATATTSGGGSGNGGSSSQSTAAGTGGNGGAGSSTTARVTSQSNGVVTTTAPAATTTGSQCLIAIPPVCFSIAGLSAGAGLLTAAGNCLTAITSPSFQATPNLDLSGVGRAATCLANGLLQDGNSILACLQTNIVCGTGSGAASTTGAAGTCVVTIPGVCSSIQGLSTGLGLVTAAGNCLAAVLSPSFQSTPGLDLGGVTRAVTCLGQGLLADGNTIFGCLQTNLICLAGSGSGSTSATAAAATTSGLIPSLLACIPVTNFAACTLLGTTTGLTNVIAQGANCLTGLLAAQAAGGLTSTVTSALNNALTCVSTANVLSAATGSGSGASLLQCITNLGVVSC